MVTNRPVYSRGAQGRRVLKNTSEELLEVVDERNGVVGRERRGVIHARGLMHRSAQVFVFNARGELFLQKRSAKKDEFPGLWDSSAAGHVDPGESYEDCARRELEEELGIAEAVELEPLFQIPASADTGFEHCSVFRCRHDGPMTLQPHEVDDGRWVAPAEMDRLVEDEKSGLTPAARRIWRLLKSSGNPGT
jgi:isopentenyl-diphosphate delta-isomerase type 1